MLQFETRIRAFAFVVALLATSALCAGVALAQSTAGSTGGTSHDAHADAMSRKHSPATIARVQRRLGVRPVSGVYGPLTRAAVRRFQKRHDLTVDGLLGPQTLRALGLRRARSESTVQVPAALRRIAQCESGGNPRAVSPDGRYRGKYQFDVETWRSLGGKGDPADAPEAEQDRLAVRLYRQRGTAPWANCAS